MGTRRLTAAEATDRHGRYLLVAIILVSAMSFSNAVETVAGPALADTMRIVQLVLVAGVVAMLLPCAAWKLGLLRRVAPDDRRDYFAPDSFTVHAFKHGKSTSWSVALVLLIVLGPVSDRLPEVPADFFFDLALGVMLGVFGVSALILSR